MDTIQLHHAIVIIVMNTSISCIVIEHFSLSFLLVVGVVIVDVVAVNNNRELKNDVSNIIISVSKIEALIWRHYQRRLSSFWQDHN